MSPSRPIEFAPGRTGCARPDASTSIGNWSDGAPKASAGKALSKINPHSMQNITPGGLKVLQTGHCVGLIVTVALSDGPDPIIVLFGSKAVGGAPNWVRFGSDGIIWVWFGSFIGLATPVLVYACPNLACLGTYH